MLVVRLFVLYRVFKQHRPFQGRVVYIAYIVPLSFNLAISLVGQFLPRKYTIVFDPVNRICVPIKLWSYITLAIGFALWFVLIFYVVMLRNIVSSFNEFRESLIIFAIATLFVIKTVALNITHPMFPLEGTFRLISTIFDVLMANSIILSILVYPVYQCAFHHDDYDIEWRMKLNRDQLEKEYSLTPMDNQIETELITKSITHNDQGYYTNDRQGLSDERIFTPESNIYHNQGGYHHSQ
ncbi:hypothetical protein GGI12_001347 [Dipsacomyces acuminosporus]|nr:hypothetical protein GGI12_001347 [Dipsacomyces acuminosporus]